MSYELTLYVEDLELKATYSVYFQPEEKPTLEYPGCSACLTVEDFNLEETQTYSKQEAQQLLDDVDMPLEWCEGGFTFCINTDGTIELLDWNSDEVIEAYELYE